MVLVKKSFVTLNLKTVVYTTSRTLWIENDFRAIYKTLKRAGSVDVEPFDVGFVELPKEVPLVERNGGVYIDWGWLKAFLPTTNHNAVCLHISRLERDKLGLRHPNPKLSLGGVYNVDSDDVFDFVVIADKRDTSYDEMTGFERLFIHELSHGFAHWLGMEDKTHHFDYDLKDIKGIYKTYNFRDWGIQKAIVGILQKAVATLVILKNKLRK